MKNIPSHCLVQKEKTHSQYKNCTNRTERVENPFEIEIEIEMSNRKIQTQCPNVRFCLKDYDNAISGPAYIPFTALCEREQFSKRFSERAISFRLL